MRKRVVTGVVTLLMLVAPAEVGAAPGSRAANACDDPYWKQTLRCAVLASSDREGEAPQFNLDVGPAHASDIHPFTRVFLTADPSVRSLDGTIPEIYVDKAVCTDELGCDKVGYGEPVESDDWIISVAGGGSCAPAATLANGPYDDASVCLDEYLGGELQGMSTANDRATQEIGGIHLPDPALNPEFAGYNRVRIEKSSADRFLGRATFDASDGYFTESHPLTGTVTFDLYQHGRLIIEQAFEQLRKPWRYETWVDDGSGGVASVTESLPGLADAERVLLVGHSGGAHGLFHSADGLAELLENIRGFDGDVRAVFDEHFIPSMEGESGDPYAGIWSGVSTSLQTFTYDGEQFNTSGAFALQYAAWNAELDASCLKAHDGGDEWMCNNLEHVRDNHIVTPFFFKEDFSDPNPGHLSGGTVHNVTWGQCDLVSICPPQFTKEEFGTRIRAQALSLLEERATRSELATGADHGPGDDVPTVFGWMTDCGSHEGVFETPESHETRIVDDTTSYSMAEWLARFVAAERRGTTEWRIDGEAGMDSQCPDDPE